MRSVLSKLLPSILASCITVYLAAVALNGDVTSRADWWPYPWLWVLVPVALVSAVWWVVLMLRHGSTAEPEVAEAVEASGTAITTQNGPTPGAMPTEPSTPLSDTAPELTNVVEWSDMRATRAANGSWGVRWMSNGQPVGTITPIGQGYFHAWHINMGDAGQHASIKEALHGIWVID